MGADRMRPSRDKLRTDGRLLVSYPKSGRTWIRYAAAQFGIDLTVTHAGSSTDRRELGNLFSGIPGRLEASPKIFLHRNPIDTAVSMYFQVHRRDFRPLSGRWLRMLPKLYLRGALPPVDIDKFVLHPLYGMLEICEFNRTWVDHVSGREDCLLLEYEKMRSNPSSEFQKFLNFLDETGVTGNQLAEISTFERMKQVAGKAGRPGILGSANTSDPSSAKVRRGKVGGYLDELKPDTVNLCRKIAIQYGF